MHVRAAPSFSIFSLVFHQRIVRGGAGRNGWERVTLGPKSYPSSLRPNLSLAGFGIHGQTGLARSNTGSDTCVQTMVWTVFGHRLRAACSIPWRFHTPIRSLPHSRESPSISSSLTFKGHISQSCGADIHLVHSFLTGTRRLILSATAWGIHPSQCMGIDASKRPRLSTWAIGHPSCNGKMPVHRAPCICSPIHWDTTISMTRGPSAKPPHPSFFGNSKRRTS